MRVVYSIQLMFCTKTFTKIILLANLLHFVLFACVSYSEKEKVRTYKIKERK